MNNDKSRKRELVTKHASLIRQTQELPHNSLFGDVYIQKLESGQIVFTSNCGHLLPTHVIQDVIEGVKSFNKHLEGYLEFTKSTDPDEFNEALIESFEMRSHASFIKRLAEKKTNRKTFVYLMLNQRNGYYKIGRSNNPQFREETLCSQEPEITTLHIIDSNIDLETELHQTFAEKRIRGEWFALNYEDVEFIKSL